MSWPARPRSRRPDPADIEQQTHDDDSVTPMPSTGGEGVKSKRHGGFHFGDERLVQTRAPTRKIVSPSTVNQTCIGHIFCEIDSQMARSDINRSGEIEVFVRVVEAGSFSAAARALRMTPSAVSKLIARLEARLGARLVSRSTRKLQLTPEGSAFYDSGASRRHGGRARGGGGAARAACCGSAAMCLRPAPADPAAAALPEHRDLVDLF